jgi:ADP-ribosyl-[dinitrogen reductase] hydrolase
VAIRQSATTHGPPRSAQRLGCLCRAAGDAIAGQSRSQVLAAREGHYADAIAVIKRASCQGKPRPEVRASGYVAHSLQAALWTVGRTGDFRSAVLTAANLGEDDTTAAIAGQLAGALYGLSGIAAEWLKRLARRERIEKVAL